MSSPPENHHRPEPELSEVIREFLHLNRLRIRRVSMSGPQRERWEALRWQIEAELSTSEAGELGKSGRCALRVPTNLAVEMSEESDAPQRVCEIAERGVFIASERPLPVGESVQLKLRDCDHLVEVNGTVVWVRRDAASDGPSGMGVEFGELDEAQREALAFLVEEALVAL